MHVVAISLESIGARRLSSPPAVEVQAVKTALAALEGAPRDWPVRARALGELAHRQQVEPVAVVYTREMPAPTAREDQAITVAARDITAAEAQGTTMALAAAVVAPALAARR